jgi:ABC-type cobalamin/Fe3+-siderophores transport system ATPase subunit
MGIARISVSLFATIAVIAAILAGATIWLLLTDPVTVADAVNQGNVSPLISELADALLAAFRGLLRYL